MRSNNRLIALGAALAVSGCSSAWWKDPPATDANGAVPARPAQASGYPDQSYAGAPQGGDPMPSDWSTQQPGSAPPPPAYAQQPQPAYQPPYQQAQQPRYQPQQPQYQQPYQQSAQPARPSRNDVQTDYVPPAPVQRYDNVGYAAYSTEAGTVAGAHATLPPGSFVEVTSLDTGRTILVPITASARSGREIELSGMAAQELGLGGYGGDAPVRVRATNPTGADLGALRAGRPAPARPQTPPVLLNALRKKLDGTLGQVGGAPPATFQQPAAQAPAQTYPPPGASYQPQRPPAGYVPSVPARQSAPLPMSRPPAAPAQGGPGYYVQVAALSDAARAAGIARQIGGAVVSAGGTHRVRFGPFDDLRTAQAARDDIAGRGYGDARIVRQD